MKTYLITWKPEAGLFTEDEFNALKKTLRQNRFVDDDWRMRAAGVKKGERVVLFRQGKQTGLCGFGTILDDCVKQKKATRRYTVRLTNMRDSIDAPFLEKKELTGAGIKKQSLEMQSSSNGAISKEEVAVIERLCQERLGHSLDELCTQYCVR
jgi:hypothetical protein